MIHLSQHAEKYIFVSFSFKYISNEAKTGNNEVIFYPHGCVGKQDLSEHDQVTRTRNDQVTRTRSGYTNTEHEHENFRQ